MSQPGITRGIQHLVKRLPSPISGRLIRRAFKLDVERARGVEFKVADTREELEAAYELVHDVYVQEGYSDPHDSGLRINLRYALPTTATFIGKFQGKVVITMTVVGDSPLGLPMDAIFSRDLYMLRRQGRYICEVSALASDPSFRRRRQALAMYMNKTMFTYASRNLGADDLVIAVNPKHEWVYRHLILFETISKGVKCYHYVKDAPAIAMRLDLRTVEARMQRAYQGRPLARNMHCFFFESDPREIQLPATREPYNVWDEGLFSYFFEQRTDLRFDGHGSLLDLYRILYDLPESGQERTQPTSMFYISGRDLDEDHPQAVRAC